jgi:hypothetical protein
MARNRRKKAKWQTKPTGKKRKHNNQKIRPASPIFVFKFLSKFNAPKMSVIVHTLSQKTHFTNKQVRKALHLLAANNYIRIEGDGTISILETAKSEVTPAQQQLINKNRQDFIDLVRRAFKALDGLGWEGYVRDRRRVHKDLEILVEWTTHYRVQDSVPEKVLAKADMLSPLLQALAQWNQIEILEAIKPFKWPSTRVYALSQICADALVVEDTGVLSHFGYHVGRGSLPTRERREILDGILSVQTQNPKIIDGNFGPPFSCARLRRIAYTIAFLTRNAKKQPSKDYSNSIADWESDLQYLKLTYYDNKCDGGSFRWPYV